MADPLVHCAGVAASPADAEQEARAFDAVLQTRTSVARSIYEEWTRTWRRSRPSNTNAAQTTERLWYLFYTDDGRAKWIEHRITRKTKKRIYWYVEYSDDREQCVDRATLERDGKARRGREWFYTTEGKARHMRSMPVHTVEGLEALGLSWPCTGGEVKRAFRERAKTAHPDAGGTDAEFITLCENYEKALWMIGGTP
jgi:hypothetical protein